MCPVFASLSICFLFGEKFLGNVIFGQVVLGSFGVYLTSNLLYDNTIFGQDNNINVIYTNNVVVSVAQFLSLLVVFHIFADSDYLLIAFALQYPWKSVLSMVVIVLSKWVMSRG